MSGSGSERKLARPRQVTVGGVMAAAACLLLLVALFDAMSSVRSAEMRDSIRDFLSKPPGNELGISIDDVISLLRGVVLASGALAATGAVLAVYTLQRHRGARIGLSIVAVLMLFSASFVAGFLPVVVVVAAAMLWGREARDWFAGRAAQPSVVATPPPPGAPAPPASQTQEPTASWPPPQPDQQPDQQPGQQPDQQPGQQPGQPPGQQPPTQGPAASPYRYGAAAQEPRWADPAYSAPRPGTRRPAAVSTAAWLTWVLSGLTAVFFLLLVVTLLVEKSQLLTALQKNPTIASRDLSSQEILGTLWVVAAVGIFWSLAAFALAVLAFHRVNAGWVGLVVSSALALLISAVVVPFGWLNAAAAGATIVLLLRAGTRRWYAGGESVAADPKEKPPVW